MTTHVKKNEITFVHKNLNTYGNSNYSSMNTWKDRSGKSLIIGVTFSWTDYSNTPKTSDELIITDKGLKDNDIDTWITNVYCKTRELQKQESQVESLKSEITKSDTYSLQV